VLTPSRLWAGLDPGTRRLAAESLYGEAWEERSSRAEADRAIAATLHFRDDAVRRLPVDKRIDYLVRAIRPDDSLARSLLMALHLVQRSELLSAFLDALGIPQRGGVIDEKVELGSIEEGRLRAAVDGLRERFPTEQIDLYLASLVALDPDVWNGLTPLIEPAREG
jgi:hypothetical protein